MQDWLYNELYLAYKDARKGGKRKTVDEQRFEMGANLNIMTLADDILERRYEPSRGVAFIVFKPVIREIFAAPFRDRVIHHFLFRTVAGWWDRRFIYDSYSCRVGKGTLFGVNRLYKHMASVSNNFSRPAYVLKIDLQGYFMSLPRRGLFEAAEWGVRRQFGEGDFRYELCKYLWSKIIFDDPTKGIKIRGKRSDWFGLPKPKSLFYAQPECGIVIGNLTSQLLSNIYLDKLDRFVHFELGYKHYGRYVDDAFVVAESKEELTALIPKIREFLVSIGLTLHPKKIFLQEINKGVPFLSATVYPYRILPSKRLKRNFLEAVRACEEVGWENLSMDSDEVVTVVSYLGHLKHFPTWKLKGKLYESGKGYEYMWERGSLGRK
jgi:hypothetical protein